MALREKGFCTDDTAAAKTSHSFMGLTLLPGLLSAVALSLCCLKYLTVKKFMVQGGEFVLWHVSGLERRIRFQESHL